MHGTLLDFSYYGRDVTTLLPARRAASFLSPISPWFRRATERNSTRSAIVVRFRDYAARDISTFQISGGTSFLCFAFPASVSWALFLR